MMLEHVSLGILGSAAKLVTHLEKLRAAHPLGPEPFGAPRWVLEELKTRLSLLNLLQANCWGDTSRDEIRWGELSAMAVERREEDRIEETACVKEFNGTGLRP
jgi:hypothetical protein